MGCRVAMFPRLASRLLGLRNAFTTQRCPKRYDCGTLGFVALAQNVGELGKTFTGF